MFHIMKLLFSHKTAIKKTTIVLFTHKRIDRLLQYLWVSFYFTRASIIHCKVFFSLSLFSLNLAKLYTQARKAWVEFVVFFFGYRQSFIACYVVGIFTVLVVDILEASKNFDLSIIKEAGPEEFFARICEIVILRQYFHCYCVFQPNISDSYQK